MKKTRIYRTAETLLRHPPHRGCLVMVEGRAGRFVGIHDGHLYMTWTPNRGDVFQMMCLTFDTLLPSQPCNRRTE